MHHSQKSAKASLPIGSEIAEVNKLVFEKHGPTLIKESLTALLEVEPTEPFQFLANFFQRYEKSTDALTVAHEAISRIVMVDGEAENSTKVHAILWKAYANLSSVNAGRKQSGAPRTVGIKGEHYSKLISMLLKEAQAKYNLPENFVSKLQHSLLCRTHEAVPFCVFANGMLLCRTIVQFTQILDAIYAILSHGIEPDTQNAVMNAMQTHFIQVYTTAIGKQANLLTSAGVQAPIDAANLIVAIEQLSVRQLRRVVSSVATHKSSSASYRARAQTAPSLNEFRSRFYDALFVSR